MNLENANFTVACSSQIPEYKTSEADLMFRLENFEELEVRVSN